MPKYKIQRDRATGTASEEDQKVTYQKCRYWAAQRLNESCVSDMDRAMVDFFWWYRNEDDEIALELGLTRKKGWGRTNENPAI